jgi:hypothetical protein
MQLLLKCAEKFGKCEAIGPPRYCGEQQNILESEIVNLPQDAKLKLNLKIYCIHQSVKLGHYSRNKIVSTHY